VTVAEADLVLLVSLHDVTPAHADRLARAERLFDALGIPAVTYLFVPNYHGRWPAHERADFVAWCRASRAFRVQWFLHGYFHREDTGRGCHATLAEWCGRTFLTAGEAEFLALRGRALESRMTRGIDAFSSCLGERPSGFVAPAWLYNDELLPALARLRVGFTESHFHVFDLRNGRALRSPVITWASRSAACRSVAIATAAIRSRLWTREPLVRIALHPRDFDHPQVVDSIQRTIDTVRRMRSISAYGDPPV
jgi:predicted deacetylase